MPGEKVKIGPRKQGLNQREDMRNIEDDELSEVVNFNITDDGMLEPRAGYSGVDAPAHGFTLPTHYLLGSMIHTDGNQYALAAFYDSGSNVSKIYSILSDTWDARHASTTFTGPYKSVVQYNGRLWYIPGNASAQGKYTTGLTAAAATGVAAMPWGDYGFMFKDRMFIVRKSENRIYFSKATDPETWLSPDGGSFDVNPGDGQTITKVVVTNNIMTIFKRDATYQFSFVDDPVKNGTLRQVSPDQGAFDAITFNNEIYCVNSRSVFKFINGFFVDLGQKLDLFRDHDLDTSNDPGVRLSVINRLLLVGKVNDLVRGRNAWYAMNLDTNAWSQHFYPLDAIGPNTNSVQTRNASGTFSFYGDGKFTGICRVLHRTTQQLDVESLTSGLTFYPGYKFVTKEYAFNSELEWKRLFAWGIETDELSPEPNIVPSPKVGVVLNGTVNVTVDVPDDFIAQLSARFRRIAFTYNALDPDGVTCAMTNGTPGTSKVMRTFRSLMAMISTRTKVVT